MAPDGSPLIRFAVPVTMNNYAGEQLKDLRGNALCVEVRGPADILSALVNVPIRVEVLSGSAESPDAPPLRPRAERGKGALLRGLKITRLIAVHDGSKLIARLDGLCATDVSSAHPSGKYRLGVYIDGSVGDVRVKGALSNPFVVKSSRAGMPDMRKLSRDDVRIDSDVRHLPHLGDEKAKRLRSELGMTVLGMGKLPQLSVGLFLRHAIADHTHVRRLCGSFGADGRLVSMLSEREWHDIMDHAKCAFTNTTNSQPSDENLAKWAKEQNDLHGELPSQYASDGAGARPSTSHAAGKAALPPMGSVGVLGFTAGEQVTPVMLADSFARAAQAMQDCMNMAAAMQMSGALASTQAVLGRVSGVESRLLALEQQNILLMNVLKGSIQNSPENILDEAADAKSIDTASDEEPYPEVEPLKKRAKIG